MKTQFQLHGLVQAVILGEFILFGKAEKTSMLMHLRIITPKTIKITESKLKFLCQAGFVKKNIFHSGWTCEWQTMSVTSIYNLIHVALLVIRNVI